MLTLTAGWLVSFGLVALLGLVTGQGLLVGLGAIIILTWSISQGWNRASLTRVSFQRQVRPRRAFIGETVEVRLQVTNRKALPLPWIRLDDTFPSGLPEQGRPPSPRMDQSTQPVSRATALAGYERVTWSYQLECRERGVYRFGPARLFSGDVFGFFTTERDELASDQVVVYPQVVPLPALGLHPRQPFGDIRGGQPFHEDPTRLRGLRDYRPDDPLRRVDWKATARRQSLQVRVLDPSVSHSLIFMLNVETGGAQREYWDYLPFLLERGITTAASVAQWAVGQRYSVGLYTNGMSLLSQEPIRVPSSRSPQQLGAILEALAAVGPLRQSTMSEVIAREAHRIPTGATLVFVTSFLPRPLVEMIHELQREGRRISVLWVAEVEPPELPGELQVYHLGPHFRRLEAETPFRPPDTVERGSPAIEVR